jgi:SAM-dependent methyltransferase
MVPDLAQFKKGVRKTWAIGDYPTIAKQDLWEMGARIVARVGVKPDEDVLDIACGTGNTAVRAAAAGGRVVGVDITPELFEAGKREAAAAGVEIQWVEGDAEALPFGDRSFDVVLSTFGVMFAPRHDVAASELLRVLRPGGRFCIFSWCPDGAVGKMFQSLAGYMPPPPPFVMPSGLWGKEDYVRQLFANKGVQLELARELAPSPLARFAGVDERIEHYTTKFGPLVQLRAATEAQGRWPALREDLAKLYARTDDSGEYLVVLGRKG